MSNWAWFIGRPWPGMWALDLAQTARFARQALGATAVAVNAENDFGWPALLAGACAPELIGSGSVHVPWKSLHEDLLARGDDGIADVPGLLERLDIPQIHKLWPLGQIIVKPNPPVQQPR